MKNMNWKQLWTSYPPAESPRRLDFFWVDELPWSPSIASPLRLAKSLQNMEIQESCKRKRKSWWSWCHFCWHSIFFWHSIFSVLRPGKPRIFRRFKFHPQIFLGGRFWIIQPWLHIPSRLMAPIRADPDYWPLTCGWSYPRSQNSQLGGWGWGNPPEFGGISQNSGLKL